MTKQTEKNEDITYIKLPYTEEDEATEKRMESADAMMLPSKEPIVLIIEESRGSCCFHLEVKGNTMKQARAGLDYLVKLKRNIRLSPI